MPELSRPVLIVGGGTGGHIYPALAVAEYFRDHEVNTVWLGSKGGLENSIVPKAGIELIRIAVSGLRGRGFIGWITAPFVLSFALLQALAAVRRVRPRLVLGMGGFASGPGGLAAWLCRRPLVIHEQNAIAGLTNRVLGRFAKRVLCGFPDAFPADRDALFVGNPVRRAIHTIPAPNERGIETEHLRLLIVGGSRGARALNEFVPQAIATLNADNIAVWHQAGDGNSETTRARYQGSNVDARVTDFIDDMAEAYRWANIVICRAGALTVAELAAVGIASILVPFPHAVDDHQTVNAQFLVRAGAAEVVPEGQDFVPRLVRAVSDYSRNRALIIERAVAARNVAQPDAAAELGRRCLELASG